MKNFSLLLFVFVFFTCASRQNTDENQDVLSRFKAAVLNHKDDEHLASYANEIVTEPYGYENLANDVHTFLPDSLTSKMLSSLLKTGNKQVINIFESLAIWKEASATDDSEKLKLLSSEIVSRLSNPSVYESKTERYAILIAKRLVQFDSAQSILLLSAVIRNLESQEIVSKPQTGDVYKLYQRTWARYMLACSYYLKSVLASDLNERKELLRKAAIYSTDVYDMRYKGFIETDQNLIGEPLSFHDSYISFLKYIKNDTELLRHLVYLTKNIPTDTNLSKLKEAFNASKMDLSFKSFWQAELNKDFVKSPQFEFNYIINESGQNLKSTEVGEKWILIDFWGTWCAPCIEELPELQKFFESNKSDSLKIITVACKDTESKVKNFMSKNGYTFPVALGDEKSIKDFGVTEYPHKILISPEKKFIEIPSGGVDWTSYVRNYSTLF